MHLKRFKSVLQICLFVNIIDNIEFLRRDLIKPSLRVASLLFLTVEIQFRSKSRSVLIIFGLSLQSFQIINFNLMLRLLCEHALNDPQVFANIIKPHFWIS